MISFTEYLEDVLDQHAGLMSAEQRAEARRAYQQYIKPKPTGSRGAVSDKAADARKTAKFFGGRALKGTAKQKEWAEKIRADMLQDMTAEQATLVCDPKGLLTHSKFWIENRHASAKDIAEFVEEQKDLLAQHAQARQAGDAAAVARIASQYNQLTSEWGF